MKKTEESMLAIVRLFCEHIRDGEKTNHLVKRLVFGVSKSVAALRADYDKPDISTIEDFADTLWVKVRDAGATSLSVSFWREDMRYRRDYSLSGKASSEAADGSVLDGVFLRCEKANVKDEAFGDKDTFRDCLGDIINSLLEEGTSEQNVFLNGNPFIV